VIGGEFGLGWGDGWVGQWGGVYYYLVGGDRMGQLVIRVKKEEVLLPSSSPVGEITAGATP